MDENNLYSMDGTIPLGKAIPLGLQHILAMFVSNITPIIILAGICAGAGKMDSGASAFLVQNAMIIAGIGTLIQLYPLWKVGAKLPIVMGISFTFLSVAISISLAHGYGTLMGAVLAGGIIEGVLGLFAKYWKKIGLIILMIACLFNIVSKIVKRTTLKEQLVETAQYVLNQEKK